MQTVTTPGVSIDQDGRMHTKQLVPGDLVLLGDDLLYVVSPAGPHSVTVRPATRWEKARWCLRRLRECISECLAVWTAWP